MQRILDITIAISPLFFNDNFGMNFSSYVNNYRVQLVKEYLLKTDLDITQISTMCGFGTIRNFNRIFKSICGLSPSEYRVSKTR